MQSAGCILKDDKYLRSFRNKTVTLAKLVLVLVAVISAGFPGLIRTSSRLAGCRGDMYTTRMCWSLSPSRTSISYLIQYLLFSGGGVQHIKNKEVALYV
jgi:hypothetical protein